MAQTQQHSANRAALSALVPNPAVVQYYANAWTPNRAKQHFFVVLLCAGLCILSVFMWAAFLLVAIIPDEIDYFCLKFSGVWLLATVVFFALMLKHAHYYSWRYIFLGKRYRAQEEERIAALGNLSAEALKEFRRSWEECYRATGRICLEESPKETYPFCAWNEWVYRNVEFNYADALPRQKEDYLIYSLWSAAASGGGLDEFYHSALDEPFSVAELAQCIADIPISGELRAVLQKTFKEGCLLVGADWPETVGKSLEAQRQSGAIDWDLPDFPHTLICMEDETSHLLYPFEDELKALNDERLIQMFAYEDALALSRQKDCVQMWLSADCLQYVEIVYDGRSYKHDARRYCVWDEEEQKLFNNVGEWVSGETRTSLFETAELAVHDVEWLLEGFVRIV